VNKDDVLSRIEEVGIIPPVRVSSADEAMFAAEAVYRGGIPIVEVIQPVRRRNAASRWLATGQTEQSVSLNH
jgi:2-keto-3-deoxy-6-phosphogluconate aldolase